MGGPGGHTASSQAADVDEGTGLSADSHGGFATPEACDLKTGGSAQPGRLDTEAKGLMCPLYTLFRYPTVFQSQRNSLVKSL